MSGMQKYKKVVGWLAGSDDLYSKGCSIYICADFNSLGYMFPVSLRHDAFRKPLD